MRLLRIVLGACLLFVLLLLLAVPLLFGTGTGAQWLARMTAVVSAGAVDFQGVEGSFASGLLIERLRIDGEDGMQIRVHDLELQLRAKTLLRGRLHVQRLAASRVVVEPGVPGPADGPFVMPTLRSPLPLRLEELSLPVLELHLEDRVQVLTQLHLSGRLWGSRLFIREARAEYAGFFLQLAGRVRLKAPLPLDLRLGWSYPSQQLSGMGTLRGDLDTLELAQALRLPEEAVLRATLRDPAGQPQVALEAGWRLLSRELGGAGRLHAREARLVVDGGIEAWRAELETELAADRLPPTQLRLRLHGDGRHAVVEEGLAQGAGGELAVQGSVRLDDDGPRWKMDIVARNIRTALFQPGLEGELSGRIRMDGLAASSLRAELAALDGELMGRPLAGSGVFAYREGRLEFQGLELQAGRNSLHADGSVGEQLRARLRLDAPELETLWPGLSGRLEVRAELDGTRTQPVIGLDMRASALELDENRLDSLELRVDSDRHGRVDLRLEATGLEVAGQELGNFSTQLEGHLEDHRFDALLNGPLVASFQSGGGWDGRRFHHVVKAASLSDDGTLGRWQLTGSPELVLGASEAMLGEHCWRQDPASLCIREARWKPQDAALALVLQDLGLERFGRWLPAELSLDGVASGELELGLGANGLSGLLHWRQQDMHVHYTEGDESLSRALPVVGLDIALTPQATTAGLLIEGERGLRLVVQGEMDGLPGMDAALDLRLEGEFPEFALLTPLLAADVDVDEVSGGVTLDARVGGSLANPQLHGIIRVHDAGMALADLGVKLEAIELALVGSGGRSLQIEGSALAGGPLVIKGELDPLAPGGPQGWLALHGERLDAIRLAERHVQLSPDLRFDYFAGRLVASGRIVVSRADITVRELPDNAVSTSADAVVVDRPPRADDRAIMTAVDGEVEIELGRDVQIKAFGLETKLEGNLKVSQAADLSPRVFGVLRLRDGRFGAYGKQLIIERGTLGFSGPIDDPAVDIRATRQVEWEGRRVVAGIQLSGTASRPQSRVFAEPAMSEADALSFLVTGHPLQTGDSDNESVVAGAILALGVQQTSPLTEALGHAVTLDELGLTGGNTLEDTEVVAGKQISSDLYLRFSYGLFNRIGTVLARYRLNRNFSIEAASGEEQSLDLIYSVERD